MTLGKSALLHIVYEKDIMANTFAKEERNNAVAACMPVVGIARGV